MNDILSRGIDTNDECHKKVHHKYKLDILIMKRSILALGKTLGKEEQKIINGGGQPGDPGVYYCEPHQTVCFRDIFGNGNSFHPYCEDRGSC